MLSLSSTQFNSADTKDNIMVMGSMSEKLWLAILRVFASELDLACKEADMT